MFRFALFGLLIYGTELLAQINVFNTNSKEELYAFTKSYSLTPKLVDKILELSSAFPLKILITHETIDKLDGYILTAKNQNMQLVVTENSGLQKITLKTISEKFEENYSIQKYNAAKISENENAKYIKSALDSFIQNTGKKPQNISILSKNTTFGNISIPQQTRAMLLEGNGAYMFAFVFQGELYDKNGLMLSNNVPAMPVDYDRVSGFYTTSRLHPILKYFTAHEGVDLAAKQGSPVSASLDGYVSELGYSPNIGNYVRISHQNGFETVYGHLSKIRSDLTVGKKVDYKETIGLVGQTGLATGPHLHFGVKKDGHYIDPAIFLKQQDQHIHNKEFFAFVSSATEKLTKNLNRIGASN